MENKENVKKFEFIIEESDVLEKENFGSFEIVLTKQGAIWKNFSGYRVFTTPYAVGVVDGKAKETSLYSWLKFVVDFKKSINGKENEIFSEAGVTNQDFLDGLKITTEANLIKPQVIFTDVEEAQREAQHYLDWFTKKMQELRDTMASTPPEDDLKANAEADGKILLMEDVSELLDELSQNPKEG